jgi:hypothetical protein
MLQGRNHLKKRGEAPASNLRYRNLDRAHSLRHGNGDLDCDECKHCQESVLCFFGLAARICERGEVL